MMYSSIIDANLNRFREGCRVLEDIARFLLKDEVLFLEIKAIKKSIQIKPIDRTRDYDIGGTRYKEVHQRETLIDLINANALRMQEAARVLEELDNREFFKAIRFRSYEIHSEILNKVNVFLKAQMLKGSYLICDPAQHELDYIVDTVKKKKITLCQVRSKSANTREIIHFASIMKQALEDTLLIVNERVDIALGYADGVHLEQHDFPVDKARALLPADFVIGVTCHTVEEALKAESMGASYISTQTPVVLASVVPSVKVPVCAMGDIDESRVPALFKMGVSMIGQCL